MTEQDSTIGRRSFLKRAALGVGAAGALALIPGRLMLEGIEDEGGPEATTATLQPGTGDLMVAYVRDAAAGEVVLMTGTQEVVVTDQVPVAKLQRAQGAISKDA